MEFPAVFASHMITTTSAIFVRRCDLWGLPSFDRLRVQRRGKDTVETPVSVTERTDQSVICAKVGPFGVQRDSTTKGVQGRDRGSVCSGEAEAFGLATAWGGIVIDDMIEIHVHCLS